MKKSVYASLAAALLLAGCQTPAAAPPAALEAPAAERPGYRLLGAEEAISEAPIEDVRASSVRNDYFRLAYVTDDNPTSAWSPATDDDDPSLTFHIAEAARLSQLAVKITPPGVTMDIEARMHGGDWETVATDVAPSVYAQLAVIDLPAFNADYVRVTFNRVDDGDVLVCDMRWYGVPAPKPKPKPTAKPKPKPKPKKDPCGCPSDWDIKPHWGI